MNYAHRKLQERYENNPDVFNLSWLNEQIIHSKRMIDIDQERLTDAKGCLRALINAKNTLEKQLKRGNTPND